MMGCVRACVRACARAHARVRVRVRVHVCVMCTCICCVGGVRVHACAHVIESGVWVSVWLGVAGCGLRAHALQLELRGVIAGRRSN